MFLQMHLPIDMKQGTLIYAVIWINQLNRFRANLVEGSMIVSRNFRVSENMVEYKLVQYDVKITFLRIVIQKMKDDTANIPTN